MRLSRLLERLVSLLFWVFHPFFMPTWTFIVLDSYHENLFETGSGGLWFYLQVFLLTAIAPGILLLVMEKTRLISTIEIPDRQERHLPALLVSMVYILTTMYFIQKHPESGIGAFLAVMSLPALVSSALTFLTKVSIHTAAASSSSTLLISFLLIGEYTAPAWVVLSVLITGVFMTGRVAFRLHTMEEVILGAAVGVGSTAAGIALIY